MNFAARTLQAVGAPIVGFAQETGRLAIFGARGVAACLRPPYYLSEVARQLMAIGYTSLPVVGLTALFTGAVLALQIYVGGARFNAESVVASIVAIGITREIGPVIGGLMVAGRVGASIAAEIGTMRVTEQIDALETLSTDPVAYLVAPRLVAATLALPVLIAVADTLGIAGGMLVGVERLGFGGTAYIAATLEHLTANDIISGLIKAAVFGFIVALTGCYHGFHSQGGAQGVGRATTRAVVTASVLILAANYILTELFFPAA